MLKLISKITIIKFIKFLFVGGINTVFGYSIFAFLNFSGIHYSIATLIATIMGVFFNFKTYGKIVFENNNNKLIPKFIGIYSIVYLINVFSLKLLIICHINIYLASAGLLCPLAVLSYILNKKFVFRS